MNDQLSQDVARIRREFAEAVTRDLSPSEVERIQEAITAEARADQEEALADEPAPESTIDSGQGEGS